MYKAADVIIHDDDARMEGHALATDRAEACSLIVDFLTRLKGGLRSAVSSYIKYVHACIIVPFCQLT